MLGKWPLTVVNRDGRSVDNETAVVIAVANRVTLANEESAPATETVHETKRQPETVFSF